MRFLVEEFHKQKFPFIKDLPKSFGDYVVTIMFMYGYPSDKFIKTDTAFLADIEELHDKALKDHTQEIVEMIEKMKIDTTHMIEGHQKDEAEGYNHACNDIINTLNK